MNRTFEECYEEIENEIRKRRAKWNLSAVSWMDFDDCAQIIRVHIFKKWHLYDQTQPLGPWTQRLISNQLKNILRNIYSNFSRPCLKCAAAEGNDLCSIYITQCDKCPLYANWLKGKKYAHDCKLPVTIENHSQEVSEKFNDDIDFTKSIRNLNQEMQKHLKPAEWQLYNLLYVHNRSEEEAAKVMGFVTSEKNKTPGYRQLRNLKKGILLTAKTLIYDGEIDIV